MNENRLLKSAQVTFDACLALLSQRNEKYATPTSPFRNFQDAAATAGVTTEQQILGMVGLKLSRIRNYLHGQGLHSPDERFDDTLLDAINYLAILRAYVNPEPEIKPEDLIVPEPLIESSSPLRDFARNTWDKLFEPKGDK